MGKYYLVEDVELKEVAKGKEIQEEILKRVVEEDQAKEMLNRKEGKKETVPIVSASFGFWSSVR